MPIYEYRCESCGKAEEVIERLSAPDRHDCGLCGTALGMERQLSVPALRTLDAAAPMPAGPSPCAGRGCDCPFAS
jgi:putative FmdB family regulatory protein